LNAAASDRTTIRILDPHSSAALLALNNATAMYPDTFFEYALREIRRVEGVDAIVVIPDAGAVPRTEGILQRLKASNDIARCVKMRDSQTGKLSAFQLVEGSVAGRAVVIVDDICDGGGTFAGLAKVLRAHGASRIYLAVTHGIFSKGIAITGIERIYCTDSYALPNSAGYEVSHENEKDPVHRYRSLENGRERLVVMSQFVVNEIRSAER
jgi:ribose-phosphate pyrophosphokinase